MPAEVPYIPAYIRSNPFFGTGLFRSDSKTATNLPLVAVYSNSHSAGSSPPFNVPTSVPSSSLL